MPRRTNTQVPASAAPSPDEEPAAAPESSAVSLPALKELLKAHATAEEHARWFIMLRWIAVLVATVLIVIAIHILEVLPHEVWLPLFGTVSMLALLNLLYTFLLRSGKAVVLITSFQAYADLVLLTVLIHFSGGIENPLVLLMIFHVIIAGITLSRKQCFAVAGVATILFALLAWAEASNFIEHYTLQIVPHYEEHGHTAHAAHDAVYASSFVGLQGTILFLTAFFVTTLSERLRQREQQLETLAERALTQRQLLERSLETTGTGLYVCDEHLRPILTNRRWEDWFAQTSDADALNEQIFGAHAPIQQTLQDGTVRMTEIDVSDGEDPLAASDVHRTFQATTAPLLDKEGRITHVVQLVQDVTEQKEAQAQMIRAGKLAAVGELAGQVAHEVNNPIAIIIAKARLLLSDHRDGMSGRTIEELEKIVQLSDRVASIAQGLLSYCRPSVATRTRLDVSIPIRRALAMIERRSRHAGIEIEDHLSAPLPPVHANAQEMEQVFLNLFLNAIDAMPEGGQLVVSAHTETVDDAPELHLHVKDTGAGMPEDVRRHIFEPFFTTKPEGKGTGLGLSICHGLIQNYGGTIDVASAPEKGTEITIRLPVYPSEDQTRHG